MFNSKLKIFKNMQVACRLSLSIWAYAKRFCNVNLVI